VKPDKPLTAQDIMNMNRDQYEGTQFDLTADVAGGPFGDPMRWPEISKDDNALQGISKADLALGQ
jgi:dipeptidase